MSDHVEVLKTRRDFLRQCESGPRVNGADIDWIAYAKAEADALDAAIAALSAPAGWVMVPGGELDALLGVVKESTYGSDLGREGRAKVALANYNDAIAAAPQPQPASAAEQGAGGTISHHTARVMLDSLDDYARMSSGVDAKGPRETLERYIAQQETTPPLAADGLTYVEWSVLSEHFTRSANFAFAIDARVRDWIERNRVRKDCAGTSESIPSADGLPELPESWHEAEPRGSWNGAPRKEAIHLYTADQMRAYAELARRGGS